MQQLINLLKQYYLYWFIYGVGLCSIIPFLYTILRNLFNMIRKSPDFLNEYGQDSWVVITGASDGIGQAFCYQFATLGFNICLISRTLSKLQSVQRKLKQINKNIKTKLISTDFSNCLSQQSFFDDIQSKLKQLKDISILVNNVGVMPIGQFHTSSDQQLLNAIKINCVPIVLMARKTIPLLLQHRKKTGKKAGIINLSSYAGRYILPKGAIYSACKAFDDVFSRSIQAQFSDVLDILTFRPLLVSSPMTLNVKSLFHISAQTCAHEGLQYLGREKITMGHWYHRFQGWVSELTPQPIRNFVNKFLWYRTVDYHESHNKKN